MDFISQQYWDDSYKGYHFYMANDEVTRWISQQLTSATAKEAFEFGCYPGRYLSYLGKLGFKVSGMDLTPAIEESRFRDWLWSEGISAKLLKQGDVLSYAAQTEERYDLVCSFGFIEHFKDFLGVIDLHHRILKPGGTLIISVPNLRGCIQKRLHTNLNPATLAMHHLPSMDPELWKKFLLQRGYRIRWTGYFGGFDFWYDEASRNSVQRFSLKVINKIKPLLRGLPSLPAYAPYCGIVAEKSNE